MTAIITPRDDSDLITTTSGGDAGTGGPISFGACVDWLLDAHQSTTDPGLRALVIDVLGDLRELGSVEGDLAELVLGALASVEAAFEVVAAR